MSKAVCSWCRTVGWVGSECEECGHECGRSRDECRCRRCVGQCPECGGTGQRRGLFGSGYCVACNGSGRQ